MRQKKRVRHSPEQIVKKLRDADAMLNAGRDLAAVLQTLEVSESPLGKQTAARAFRGTVIGTRWEKLRGEV